VTEDVIIVKVCIATLGTIVSSPPFSSAGIKSRDRDNRNNLAISGMDVLDMPPTIPLAGKNLTADGTLPLMTYFQPPFVSKLEVRQFSIYLELVTFLIQL
jgi:hypothetical protein